MSDGTPHRMRRGRPMRSVRTEAQHAANARKRGARASRARAQNPAPVWDVAVSIAGTKRILAEVYGEDDE